MSGQAFDARRGALDALLQRAFGRRVGIDDVRALPGGVCHRSYRIATDAGSFAVKLRMPGAADVLDAAAELDVARRVAAAGLTPAPLAADADAGLLVTHYVDAAWPLTPADVAADATLQRIAVLLRALHRVPAGDTAPFGATQHAQRYVDTLSSAGPATPADADLAAELLDLAASFDARDARPVLCHGDLVADNLLETDRLWLIDFEYAAAADPVLDLASLAAMNRLGAASRQLLVDAYCDGAAAPFESADFDKVVRLLNLLAYFWAAAERRIGGGGRGLAAWLESAPLSID